ncbi:MAG: hypothetical protein UR15_C0028G0004 [Parcubacteria group bacterium GW2011_GWA2_31_28]|nr:MAG: hypothetical protein UR15_C0028G0004 [Parcubacteria group bacterium GW2011_GWA2_31_28]
MDFFINFTYENIKTIIRFHNYKQTKKIGFKSALQTFHFKADANSQKIKEKTAKHQVSLVTIRKRGAG